MKKALIYSMLFVCFCGCSQKKGKVLAKQYFPFQYENNWGVTDNLGTEIIPPIYDMMEIINGMKPKDIIILKTVLDTDHLNFNPKIGNTKDILFDRSTGTYKEYENYDIDAVKIENKNYSAIDYSILKNEESEKTIKLNSRYYYLQNLNDKYIITRKLKLKDTVTVGIYDYVVFKNNVKLPVYFETKADDYKLFYDEESASIGFDYILFQSRYDYELYDKEFKLIKRFSSQKESYEISNYCTEILDKSLSGFQKNKPNQVNENSNTLIKEPLYTVEVTNGYNEFLNIATKKKVFKTKNQIDYYWLDTPNIVVKKSDNQNESRFYIDEKTLNIYMPDKYLKLLDIIKIKNQNSKQEKINKSKEKILQEEEVNTFNGDFNGDGKIEIGYVTKDLGFIYFLNNRLEPIYHNSTKGEFRFFNEGDLNNDGNNDLSVYQSIDDSDFDTMATYSYKNGEWVDLIKKFHIYNKGKRLSNQEIESKVFIENNKAYYYDFENLEKVFIQHAEDVFINKVNRDYKVIKKRVKF
ncbi:hypothetical protein [Flavobacterium sp.]|uniref:hypothetical protein n=1 Tax=Flavobacterium sp. TaxID=239 RepID=UPI003753D480